MRYPYSNCTSDLLGAEPAVNTFSGWRVESLSFCQPGNVSEAPLILLGGAFQNGRSFRREIERFLPVRPVIVVSLPGQGTNAQRASELSFDGLARLLRQYMDAEAIERATVAGLSYGGAIAYRFAALFPERVEKLILGGFPLDIPDALRARFNAALWLTDHVSHEEWVWMCVTSLFNLPAGRHTGARDPLLRRFANSLLQVGPRCQSLWRDNTERMLRTRLEGDIRAPALVFSGEHDNFIPPHLVAEVARSIPRAEFGILAGVDHLGPVERGREIVETYATFIDRGITDERYHFVRGEAAHEHCRERRQDVRLAMRNLTVEIVAVDGRTRRGALRNLSYRGARLDCDRVDAGDAAFRVRFAAHGIETWAALQTAGDGLRAHFLPTSLGTARALEALVYSLSPPARARASALAV